MKIKNKKIEYFFHLLVGFTGLALVGIATFNLLAPSPILWMNWWQILISILLGICLINVKLIDD